MKSLQATNVAYQAPLSMGFSRQEYWNGLPFPFPGDLPDTGIEPGSPALQADALPSEPPGKPSVSSVTQSCATFCDPHESQHTRPLCPLPTPRVYPNSCPSSRWCHPSISSSVVPFSSCPQSLPASGSFPMSQLFSWGGQSIGVSAVASVLPMNTQDWSPLGWTGWISLQSKGLSRVFSNTTGKSYISIYKVPLYLLVLPNCSHLSINHYFLLPSPTSGNAGVFFFFFPN